MDEINFDIILLTVSLLIIGYIVIYANRVVLYEDPMIYKLKADLILVDPRTKYVNFYASNQSFTEDKKRVYLCLKDKDGNYYPYNMLIYVACHELAHAFSSSIDKSHTTEEFKTNYINLLTKARDLGLYDPDEPIVEQYCKY
jgi:hypothetical protein